MGRLKLQYFLAFAVNGCIVPFMPLYLQQMNLSLAQVSMVMAISGLAIVLSPVLVTLIADAHLEARRVLTGLLVLATMALLAIPMLSGFWAILTGFLLMSVVFVPAVPLQDGITFASQRLQEQQGLKPTGYHKVRVWGTIGFLAPGLLLYLLVRHWSNVTVVLYVAAAFAVLAAINSMLIAPLPRDEEVVERKLPTVEAARALFGRQMIVFCIASFLLQMAATSYYTFYPLYLSQKVGIQKEYAGMIMNIGQAIEILFMLSFGRLTAALGPRRFLMLGAMLMAVRMMLLAAFPVPAVAISTQVFHGIMVLLLQVGPIVLIDRIASDQFRHSIQGLYAMVVLGGGRIVGNLLVGPIARQSYTDAYWWSAGLVAVALVLIMVGYHPAAKEPEPVAEPEAKPA